MKGVHCNTLSIICNTSLTFHWIGLSSVWAGAKDLFKRLSLRYGWSAMYQKVCGVQNVILSVRPLKSAYLYIGIGVTVAYPMSRGAGRACS